MGCCVQGGGARSGELRRAGGGGAESSGEEELSEEELQEHWRQRLLPLGLHVDGRLGKGSLALVYRAAWEREREGTPTVRAGAAAGDSVAVKVLLPKVIDKEKVCEEFRTEAKIWSALDHPNVARVLDVLDVGRHTAIVSAVCSPRGAPALLEAQRKRRSHLAGYTCR